MQKGVLIAIDGIDGAGKASQTRRLIARLASDGVPAETLSFPTYDEGFFGPFLAELAAGHHGDAAQTDPRLASLPYALNRFEMLPRIHAWLAEGKTVVVDRFTSANQIHQGGKIADDAKRKQFLSWLNHLEHDELGIPQTDAVIYLRMPVETALSLLDAERGRDTLERARSYMDSSFLSAEALATTEPNWHTIECVVDGALRSREDIHEDVYRVVSELRDRV